MSKRFARVDNNQKEIVNELRKKGYSVKHVHEIKGFVDIVVGHKGYNFLFEIKTDRKKKLTEKEKEFADNWEGQHNIICSAKDAIDFIKAYLNSF